jgi:hypothetical protein
LAEHNSRLGAALHGPLGQISLSEPHAVFELIFELSEFPFIVFDQITLQ